MNRTRAGFFVLSILAVAAVGCGRHPNAVLGPPPAEVVQRDFTVVEPCSLTVEDFAGRVSVHSGGAGVVEVIATKRAGRPADLGRIRLEMSGGLGGVRIVARDSSGVSDASVDLDIVAPSGTRLVLLTGVGDIRFTGQARGECQFAAGTGLIDLALAGSPNVTVDLSVGVGSIDLALPVAGYVTRQMVRGVIGTGVDGAIHASAGVGGIRLAHP